MNKAQLRNLSDTELLRAVGDLRGISQDPVLEELLTRCEELVSCNEELELENAELRGAIEMCD